MILATMSEFKTIMLVRTLQQMGKTEYIGSSNSWYILSVVAEDL